VVDQVGWGFVTISLGFIRLVNSRNIIIQLSLVFTLKGKLNNRASV